MLPELALQKGGSNEQKISKLFGVFFDCSFTVSTWQLLNKEGGAGSVRWD
jgi:hypothetical protein